MIMCTWSMPLQNFGRAPCNYEFELPPRSPISCKHLSLWRLRFDCHQTTYQLNLGRKTRHSRPIYSIIQQHETQSKAQIIPDWFPTLGKKCKRVCLNRDPPSSARLAERKSTHNEAISAPNQRPPHKAHRWHCAKTLWCVKKTPS